MTTREKVVYRNSVFTPEAGALAGTFEITQPGTGDHWLFLPGQTLVKMWVTCFGWQGEDAVASFFANTWERHNVGIIMTFGNPPPAPPGPASGPDVNWLHHDIANNVVTSFSSQEHLLLPNGSTFVCEANRGPVPEGEQGGLWWAWESQDTDVVEGWTVHVTTVVLQPS